MLPRNVFAPSSASFLIATPLVEGSLTDTCTGGLPTTRFRRITFPLVPKATTIPLALPLAMLVLNDVAGYVVAVGVGAQ